MAGFKYFGDKSWDEITREERYFCAEIFYDIRKNIKGFINFLNVKFQAANDVDQNWEVGYEVCFYRDFLFSIGKSVKLKYAGQKYPQKRTFDLCLFSANQIIFIEAKVDQKFDKKQLDYLSDDITKIKRILGDKGKHLVIDCFLLNSSYKEREIKGFDKFTWKDLFELFNENPIYKVADELPIRKKPKKFNLR